MDFSGRRTEEVISFFWRSVYNGLQSFRKTNLWEGLHDIKKILHMDENMATKDLVLYRDV